MAVDRNEDQSEIELVASVANATMTARDAAQFILSYAKKHRILRTVTDDDVPDTEYSALEFSRTRKKFESQNVLEALRNREINFVGYDETRRRVLVFTKKKVTKQVQRILPTSVEKQINIEYFEGGVALVRGAPYDSFRPDPYTFLAGKYYACGSSIYPANCIGAGTLGLLARDSTGKLYGVTNNHVTGVCNNAEPGLPILAPGPVDVRADGCEPFTIGRHSALLPIHDGHPENINIDKNLDAASFLISDEGRVSSMQGEFFDTPATVSPLQVGMRVEKVGRTTGRTSGEVVAVAGGPTPVGYEVREYDIRKSVYFKDCHVFVVQHKTGGLFSARGDSGSLVVAVDDDGNRTAVGLVFAGDEKNGLSFILPLHVVLDHLKLNIVAGHNV